MIYRILLFNVINVNADAVASDRTTTESQIFDGEGEEAIIGVEIW